MRNDHDVVRCSHGGDALGLFMVACRRGQATTEENRSEQVAKNALQATGSAVCPRNWQLQAQKPGSRTSVMPPIQVTSGWRISTALRSINSRKP